MTLYGSKFDKGLINRSLRKPQHEVDVNPTQRCLTQLQCMKAVRIQDFVEGASSPKKCFQLRSSGVGFPALRGQVSK